MCVCAAPEVKRGRTARSYVARESVAEWGVFSFFFVKYVVRDGWVILFSSS